MANTTTKPMSTLSLENVFRGAANKEDNSITTSGFLTGKIGHKVTRTDINATTEDYSFFDGSVLLYTFRIIYTDASQDKLASAERTA